MSMSTLVDRGGEGSLIELIHFTYTFFALNKEKYVFALQMLETTALGARKDLKLVSIRDPPLFCLPRWTLVAFT